MIEPKPSLSELAQRLSWTSGLPIGSNHISEALKSAGIDPSDERERQRLQSLVIALGRLRVEDDLNGRLADVAGFLEMAKERAGENASVEELVELAHDLKCKFEAEQDHDS